MPSRSRGHNRRRWHQACVQVKSAARSRRDTTTAAEKSKLAGLIAKGDGDDLSEINKLRKTTARPRADIIASCVKSLKKLDCVAGLIGAPFEADEQLASLILQGVVDVVYSDDSDIPTLGALRTIQNFKHRGAQVGACNLLVHTGANSPPAAKLGVGGVADGGVSVAIHVACTLTGRCPPLQLKL